MEELRAKSKWGRNETLVQHLPTFSSIIISNALVSQELEPDTVVKYANAAILGTLDELPPLKSKRQRWNPLTMLYATLEQKAPSYLNNPNSELTAMAASTISAITQQNERALNGSKQTLAISGANPDARKIYVGNLLAGEATPQKITDFFTRLMRELPGAADLPCIVVNCSVASAETFGFIEFASERLTSTALKFNGIDFLGRPMHIGRPSKFVPNGTEDEGYDIQALFDYEIFSTRHSRTFSVDHGEYLSYSSSEVPALTGPALGVNASESFPEENQVFVTNVSPEYLTAANLKEMFTPVCTALPSYDKDKGPGVVHVEISATQTYAFVALQSPDMVPIICQIFDSTEVGGSLIKIKPRKQQ